MRCLPPDVAPIPNDFVRLRRDCAQEVTKPLLYRLSYVGADFLMILACSERERDDPKNRCPCPRSTWRESPSDLEDLLSGHATVRRPHPTVVAVAVSSAKLHT